VRNCQFNLVAGFCKTHFLSKWPQTVVVPAFDAIQPV
jgi:hypothetical protein